MNMRNINVITARSVPDKTVSDDFIHAVLSNCVTKIALPAPEKFSPESLPGQPWDGKSVPVEEIIDRIIRKYKEPFGE